VCVCVCREREREREGEIERESERKIYTERVRAVLKMCSLLRLLLITGITRCLTFIKHHNIMIHKRLKISSAVRHHSRATGVSRQVRVKVRVRFRVRFIVLSLSF
jgi:hypothetical protein